MNLVKSRPQGPLRLALVDLNVWPAPLVLQDQRLGRKWRSSAPHGQNDQHCCCIARRPRTSQGSSPISGAVTPWALTAPASPLKINCRRFAIENTTNAHLRCPGECQQPLN